jgi:hypothetical protein
MDLEETEARGDCANEGQQQFNRVNCEIIDSQRGREAVEYGS